MPNTQLSQYPEEVIKIIQAVEFQQRALELLILKTPTSNVRDELTNANIHLMGAINDLKNLV